MKRKDKKALLKFQGVCVQRKPWKKRKCMYACAVIKGGSPYSRIVLLLFPWLAADRLGKCTRGPMVSMRQNNSVLPLYVWPHSLRSSGVQTAATGTIDH